MTRNIPIASRCLCGSEPRCPFHAPAYAESWFDKICREARAAVERRYGSGGYRGNASDPLDPTRNKFKRAVIAEIDRRLSEQGFPTETGLATPESIASQRQWAAVLGKRRRK